MDPASADLAQEMQLRDLCLLNDDDGFTDETVSDDTRIAYGLFQHALTANATAFSNRILEYQVGVANNLRSTERDALGRQQTSNVSRREVAHATSEAFERIETADARAVEEALETTQNTSPPDDGNRLSQLSISIDQSTCPDNSAPCERIGGDDDDDDTESTKVKIENDENGIGQAKDWSDNKYQLSDYSYCNDSISSAGSDLTTSSEHPSLSLNTPLSSLELDGGRLCAACGDNVFRDRFVLAPCGHVYCSTCINELFELPAKDQSMFPPRCCAETIPLDSATLLLRYEVIAAFESIIIEFSTANRTYCCDPTCGKFIPPSAVDGEKALCTHCQSKTCVVCKNAAHDEDCPEDPAYNLMVKFAKEKGYQKCPRCKHMIELTVGCYHME